jgi:hypothetical protein
VPLATVAQKPIADPRLSKSIEVPSYVRRYRARRHKA